MKHILLAITGMSPAVVTETLYAINKEGQPWPSEIHVITTSVGRDKVEEGLTKKGYLHKLCSEIKRQEPELKVLVIPDANGKEVDDARSKEDHEALANFIMEETYELTKQENTQLHTSIAGGRKTMTYYMGYAMSLFGRPQDRLSHVLVSDDFEMHPEFFYPSNDNTQLTNRSGKTMLSKDIEITLADIPFIRLENNISPVIKQIGKSRSSFRDIVDLINLSNTPEDVTATLNLKERMLYIFNAEKKEVALIEFESYFQFAFYVFFARESLDETRSIYRPKDGYFDIVKAEQVCDNLIEILSIPLDSTASLEIKVDAIDLALHDRGVQIPRPRNIKGKEKLKNTLDCLKEGIDKSWFDTNLNGLKSELEKHLPEKILDLVIPMPLYNSKGIKQAKATKARGKSSGYALKIANDKFKIV